MVYVYSYTAMYMSKYIYIHISYINTSTRFRINHIHTLSNEHPSLGKDNLHKLSTFITELHGFRARNSHSLSFNTRASRIGTQ